MRESTLIHVPEVDQLVPRRVTVICGIYGLLRRLLRSYLELGKGVSLSVHRGGGDGLIYLILGGGIPMGYQPHNFLTER
jgi:hypothetical protein